MSQLAARTLSAKAKDYLASAQDNLDLERMTPAAGDAIHAGISAKDAIVTALQELVALKGDVEYGTQVPTSAQRKPLVRRARF